MHRVRVIGGTCRRGHLLTEETALRNAKGYIECRTCRNTDGRDSYAAKQMATREKTYTETVLGLSRREDRIYELLALARRRERKGLQLPAAQREELATLRAEIAEIKRAT